MRISLAILIFGLMAACSSTPVPIASPDAKGLQKVDAGMPSTANQVPGPAAPMANTAKVECANKNDKRSLELRSKGKGCEVAYNKMGAETIVASSANGNSHCEATIKKIQDKLKGSGYTCN